MKIYLTNLSLKELKKNKTIYGKSYFLDMHRLIEENFKDPSNLNNAQYWILNQMLVKKIENFLTAKYDIVYIYSENPSREKARELKELISENNIKNVTAEIFKV